MDMNNPNLESRAADVLARAKAAEENGVAPQGSADAVAAHFPGAVPTTQSKDIPKLRENPIPDIETPRAVRVASQSYPEPAHEYAPPYANVDSPDDGTIAPPPSEEEMRRAGMVTGSEIQNEPFEDDDVTVIISGSKKTTPPATEEDETLIFSQTAKENTPAMTEDARTAFIEAIMPEIKQYQKDLILNEGMTRAEASQAAQNRMKRQALEANNKFAEAHPEGVIVTIDKSQEDKFEVTPEMEEKLQRAKALRLVVVESKELETLSVKEVPSEEKMGNIRSICGSLAHYSVPLLGGVDFATFEGAQTGVLANATLSDDDSSVDVIDKKATLLYKYFAGSTLRGRKNPEGKEYTYEEFCNWFKYEDIDLGVYAIITASSMEVTETTYVCQNERCRNLYQIKYNNKALLDLSEIPDEFKRLVEQIDAARSNPERMAALAAERAHNTRLKSPQTNNIYELYTPTIAEARTCFSMCEDMIDASNAINLIFLLYIRQFWVYDSVDGKYIHIDCVKEPREAFEVLCRLHQIDLELLTKYINDHKYNPTFKIKTKCPRCGREEVDVLNVDNMIFLLARASFTGIA